MQTDELQRPLKILTKFRMFTSAPEMVREPGQRFRNGFYILLAFALSDAAQLVPARTLPVTIHRDTLPLKPDVRYMPALTLLVLKEWAFYFTGAAAFVGVARSLT